VAYTLALWGWRRHSGGDYDVAESVHFDVAEVVRLIGRGVYGPADVARLFAAEVIDDKGLAEISKATGRDFAALAR
jgi:hypothetical protein